MKCEPADKRVAIWEKLLGGCSEHDYITLDFIMGTEIDPDAFPTGDRERVKQAIKDAAERLGIAYEEHAVWSR